MIPTGYQYVRTYIGLPIVSVETTVGPETFQHFPQSVMWRGNALLKKDDFHVTICKGEDVWQRAGLDASAGEVKLLALFERFVKEQPIALGQFNKDFRFIQKEEKKSIIIRCTVKNLDLFFEALNVEFGIQMPLQPAHITLYTLQKNVGIHIATESEMLSLEKVSLSELEAAYESLKKAP